MAYSIETRLGRLEAATSGGDAEPPCPECGWPDDGAGDEDDTYEIVFGDDEPMFCETCGSPFPEIVFPDDHREVERGR